MKKLILSSFVFLATAGGHAVTAATVAPVRADFSDVFPTISEQVRNVVALPSEPVQFVRFNLLTPANVTWGATGFAPYDVTQIRITQFDLDALGNTVNIAFGSDTFPDSANPFSSRPELLVAQSNLAPGTYALAISGAGNRILGGGEDFQVRLNVTAVPLPAAGYMLLAGLSELGFLPRSKNQSKPV